MPAIQYTSRMHIYLTLLNQAEYKTLVLDIKRRTLGINDSIGNISTMITTKFSLISIVEKVSILTLHHYNEHYQVQLNKYCRRGVYTL